MVIKLHSLEELEGRENEILFPLAATPETPKMERIILIIQQLQYSTAQFQLNCLCKYKRSRNQVKICLRISRMSLKH